MRINSLPELKKIANQIRQDIMMMLTRAGSGHSGGSLGMADIFTALYFNVLNQTPTQPQNHNRDRLVLSHGHICPVLYATLARAGYFPLSQLQTLRKINSQLQGHPHRASLPGIETSSGPLGQGISQAVGLALAGKMDGLKHKIFCLMSDGEQDEGQVWEALMTAHKYHLDNLIVIIDRNGLQIDGPTEKIMPLESLRQKYLSFGWTVLTMDGHNLKQIIKTLNKAKTIKKPVAIIAKTILGKGVKFMENKYIWHGQVPSTAEAQKALEELRQAKL
jgi:transketolase